MVSQSVTWLPSKLGHHEEEECVSGTHMRCPVHESIGTKGGNSQGITKYSEED